MFQMFHREKKVITFEEAKAVLRTKYPNNYIRHCFFYENQYVFALSIDDKYVEDDYAVLFISVNSITKDIKLFHFWKEVYAHMPERIDTNIVYVCPEEIEEMKKYK